MSSLSRGFAAKAATPPGYRMALFTGLEQRRMGAVDENMVLIRFYRKKFTIAGYSAFGLNAACF